MAELQWLTHADFAGRVGDAFIVTVEGGSSVRLELVEATEGDELGGEGPDGQRRHQFSVVFRGPGTAAFGQATRRITHQELGELDLFLVPIARDTGGVLYEAAFA